MFGVTSGQQKETREVASSVVRQESGQVEAVVPRSDKVVGGIASGGFPTAEGLSNTESSTAQPNGPRNEADLRSPLRNSMAECIATPEESVWLIEEELAEGHVTEKRTAVPTAHHSRRAEILRKRVEVEKQQLKLRQMELELIELEDAGYTEASERDGAAQRVKAEEWLSATDHCAANSAPGMVPPTPCFASTANPPRMLYQDHPQVPDYTTWRKYHDEAHRRTSFQMPPSYRSRTYAGATIYSSANLTQSQISARQGAVGKELPVFSGAVEEWPMFIRMFERSTELCGFSEAENLLRLQRALIGEAKESVGHLLLLPDGLNEVMETLEVQFGRPDQIIEATVEKVRRMPAPNPG